jgi:NitT/TauT family transport system substrate-binding protein
VGSQLTSDMPEGALAALHQESRQFVRGLRLAAKGEDDLTLSQKCLERQEVPMSSQQTARWSRRQFLGGLTLAGTAGFLGLPSEPVAAEPPPEITKLTLAQVAGLCVAPQFVAEELLQGEGFTEVQYIKPEGTAEVYRTLASGEAQISMAFVAPFIMYVDIGHPLVLLGGVHVGCFELFATERVRAIRDLKGKTVAVPDLGPGSSQYIFLASMLAYVGLDPGKDVNWVVHPRAEGMRLLAEEKVDAFMGFPPEPQEMRAKKIGHVVVNSAADRPWSQYFCCMVASSREFVRKHPVATKRALRAILKAADVCALEPGPGRPLPGGQGPGKELRLCPPDYAGCPL